MWCDVIWCDVIWCDVMGFDMRMMLSEGDVRVMLSGLIWCDVMWCDVMWCKGDVRVMWYDLMWGWCEVMWGWCEGDVIIQLSMQWYLTKLGGTSIHAMSIISHEVGWWDFLWYKYLCYINDISQNLFVRYFLAQMKHVKQVIHWMFNSLYPVTPPNYTPLWPHYTCDTYCNTSVRPPFTTLLYPFIPL